MSTFEFTKDWFNDQVKLNFDSVFKLIAPTNVLEIGSFEGAATCHIIDSLAAVHDLELHCIDTWQGSIEYAEESLPDTKQIDMTAVERRFHSNTKLALEKAIYKTSLFVHKGRSTAILAQLIQEQASFDFIYIDASHQAPDVLCDAVMAFQVLKVGGIIGFDDYLWFEPFDSGRNILRTPKIAIDAFTNIYSSKLDYLISRSDQVYVRRIA